jgi:molybdopterin synthase catalytic subunit
MRTAVVDRPLDPAALLAEVASPEHGATSLFVGTVRDEHDGRPVLGIDYSAYRETAERELGRIAAEAAERFGTSALVVEHRVGELALGEASIVIVAAHAHRTPAIEAMRYVLEEAKARLPIGKRERFADGSRESVDADPEAGETP